MDITASQAASCIWIGRARGESASGARSGGGHPARTRCVRWVTHGSFPEPSASFEEIDDPFDDATDPDVDPYERARSAIGRPGRGTLADLQLLPPVRPQKVLAVGRNYRAHAAELGHDVPTRPMLFTKCPSSLVGSGAAVELPPEIERVDMEAELVVIVGRRAKNLTHDIALEHIGGLTLGNDVSARDYQKRDKHWTHAKGLDGFGPVGPLIRMLNPAERNEQIWSSARICGDVDGSTKQDGPVSAMVFDLSTLMVAASRRMTLMPGDLIFSGTPEGVTPLQPGMQMRIRCSGLDLGELRNETVAAPSLPATTKGA